jgi:hypothetical protein
MSTLANDTDVAKELMLHPERLLQGKNLNLDASGRISVKTAPRKKR